MTTEINRYAKGKIYMIESASTGLVYYGSTCMPLYKRLHTHKNAHKIFQNNATGFTASFKVLEQADFKIVLVEQYPCESKMQLESREAHYIRNFECVNKNIPCRSRKEYYEDNKEHIQEWKKQYRIENNEKIKQYRIENKEHMKQYRIDNKESINKNKRTIVQCVTCNCALQKTELSRHSRSKKHLHNLLVSTPANPMQ